MVGTVIAMVVLVVMLFKAGTWISKCCLVSFHLFFPFLLVLAAGSMLRLRSPMMLAASVMTKLGKLNYPDDRNFVRNSGTQDGAKRGWSSAWDSGSDVTTTAYKGRGALSTEAVVPKPQSDHRRHIATDGRRRQVLVRLEMLHHYHSDHPDSHTPARYPPLGLIQIRPNACTVILKLILFQNIVEPTRIWNKA